MTGHQGSTGRQGPRGIPGPTGVDGHNGRSGPKVTLKSVLQILCDLIASSYSAARV